LNILETDDEDRYLKVSGIGRDRVGIVHKVANVISSHGGNIILQQTMRVAGDFGLILIATFKKDDQEGLEKTIESLKGDVIGEEFVLLPRETSSRTFAEQVEGGIPYFIDVYGLDQTGIVQAITLILFQFGINLESMSAEVLHDPFSGTKRFSARFSIMVPPDLDMEGFEAELRLVGDTNGLDVILRRQ